MDWINDPRLWIAATPCCVFIAAVFAFYFATESGDSDPVPVVHLGDAENEPWGTPVATKNYRLPGDSVRRSNWAIEQDTTELAHVSL